MKVIEAPEVWELDLQEGLSLFLGGGITGCTPWRAEIIASLEDTDLILLNPERKDFDVEDKSMSYEQIEWEFEHMRKSSGIMFWFCEETLCPITLYELGAWAMTNVPLFVGCHPEYKRAFDVNVQVGLVRKDVPIVYSLPMLVHQIYYWSEFETDNAAGKYHV